MNAFFKNQSGVAATEFALLAPVLIFMLIAMYDYGMYMNTSMKLENTSMAAAQYLIQGGDEALITNDIILAGNLNLTEDTIDSVDVDVDYFYECDDGISVEEGSDCGEDDYLREYVQVKVSMAYETILPYPGIADTINLFGKVRLQKQ